MAREMKDSGIPWIGKIPADWQTVKFSQVASIKCNLVSPRDYSDYPQVSPENIEKGTGKLLPWKTVEESGIISGNHLFNEGQILYSKIRPKLNKVCIAPFSGLCSADMYPIESDQNIRFLMYCMLSDSFVSQVSMVTEDRVKMPKINQNELGNLILAFPAALSGQERIVRFLDSKCAEIDAVLEKIRISIEEYKKLKQAVITRTVTKGVRGNSGNWTPIKIKWLLNERKERSTGGTEEPLSMSQKYGIRPTKDMDIVPNMASSFVGAKLVYSGDLVFNKLKAHLGVFSVSQYYGLVSPDYAVYHTTKLAYAKYLEYLFKTPQYISEFKKKATGIAAGLTRLYTNDLYSIVCVLPPIEEQQEIVDFLTDKVGEIDVLIQKKERFLAELETCKKSLIYEYVTGKKEVPHGNN